MFVKEGDKWRERMFWVDVRIKRPWWRSQVTKKQYNTHLFSFSFLAHLCLKTNTHPNTHHIEVRSDGQMDIRMDTGVHTGW